jgi:hypothetical protein
MAIDALLAGLIFVNLPAGNPDHRFFLFKLPTKQ